MAASQAPEGAIATRLDGELDDAAWQAATPVTAFVQRDPSEGAPPTFRTEARVAYDATGIYIAVRAFDPEPSRIVGYLTRRDSQSSSDWIRVLVDSYSDRRTAYEFAVNPAGVKQDRYWFNDNSSDDSWDAVWDVVVMRDDQGWRAQFRIPFSQLRFSAQSANRIGFAVVREVARLKETSTWPLLARSASGYVSSFGELTGVTPGRSAKRLELVPYSVAQVATSPRDAGNPLQNPTDPGASLGIDMKYAVTPALTLSATVNPDFGQVEADPAVVNLSAFETFFSERRPFFVEGSGTYQFGIDCPDCNGLFYSRRIGRQPRGSPDLPDGGHSVQPAQSTILGAAKLTGRVGKYSVGVLHAVTQQEKARIAERNLRRSEVVEPMTFYSIGRARREFADRSSLGFMITSTNRKLVDTVSFLPGDAVTGGMDFDWRLGKSYSLAGTWAASSVRGAADAIARLQESNVHLFQRPDAEHLGLDRDATSLNGYSTFAAFAKIAGERVRFSAYHHLKSPGFDFNDLGFQRRADEQNHGVWVQWRFPRPGKYVRDFNVYFNNHGSLNAAGERLWIGANVNAHWTFQNNWSTGGGFIVNRHGFDDRATRGGPAVATNGNLGQFSYFNTDDRKLVSFNLFSFWINDRQGSQFMDLNPSLTVRPTTAVSVQIGGRVSPNTDDSQWVEKVEDGAGTHYVFGRLKHTTSSMNWRVNYTMTPNLSLQLYAEPFVSAGHYEHYKQLASGRAARYADRYARFAYDGNADFNYLSFRTTNVLRWEFRPGSTLFVVWQQGREESGDRGTFRFGRDFRDVFSTPSSNTLLVKLAYWFNM